MLANVCRFTGFDCCDDVVDSTPFVQSVHAAFGGSTAKVPDPQPSRFLLLFNHHRLINKETMAWPILVPLEKFETEALQQFWNEPSQRQVKSTVVIVTLLKVLDWIQKNGESEKEIAVKVNQFHERMQITLS